jgi:hypothetical protein
MVTSAIRGATLLLEQDCMYRAIHASAAMFGGTGFSRTIWSPMAKTSRVSFP